jgi:hypothetical protein
VRKKLKLSSDGGDSGSKKCIETMVAPMVGHSGVCYWRESESGGRFCVGACILDSANFLVIEGGLRTGC